MIPNPWTPEDDARLRALRAEGVPYSEISKILGRTKGSSIRRAHTLKIPSKPRPPKPGKREKKSFVRTTPKPPTFDLNAFEGEPRVRSVLDLEPHHCRWPLAGGFCGCDRADVTVGPRWAQRQTPYCVAHDRMSKKSAAYREGDGA